MFHTFAGAQSVGVKNSDKDFAYACEGALTHEVAIGFANDSDKLDLTYGDNAIVLQEVESIVRTLLKGDYSSRVVVIDGAASPVGVERYNKELALRRALSVRNHLRKIEGSERLRIKAVSIGEDWETFKRDVSANFHHPARAQVLEIINSNLPNEEKEARLIALDEAGAIFRLLIDGHMASSRNAAVIRIIEVAPLTSNVTLRNINIEKLSSENLTVKEQSEELVATAKTQKSGKSSATKSATTKSAATKSATTKSATTKSATTKSVTTQSATTKSAATQSATTQSAATKGAVTENVATESTATSNAVAESSTTPSTVTPGTATESVVSKKSSKSEKEKSIESFADRKPIMAVRTNLLVPALNAGVEVPIGNHWSVGADYYFPWVWPKKDNKDCFEMLSWGIEGRYWFGKNRTEYDRLKGHSVGLYGYMGYYDFERNYHGHQGEFVNVGVDYTYAMAVGKRKGLHFEFSLGVGYIYSQARKYTVIEAGAPLISDKITKNIGYFGPTKANISLVVPIFQKVKPIKKDKGNE